MDESIEKVIKRDILELLKVKEQVKSWSESGDLSSERAHWIVEKIGESINDLTAVLSINFE